MTQPHELDPNVELSLAEAAHRYGLSLRMLSQRVRFGEIPAFKVRGVRGREWRVRPRELEQLGLVAVPGRQAADEPADREMALLRRHVQTLESKLAAERHRAALLDQRLGHALLECGRLRAALTRQGESELRHALPSQGPSQRSRAVSS